jgi:hypothetical protein
MKGKPLKGLRIKPFALLKSLLLGAVGLPFMNLVGR